VCGGASCSIWVLFFLCRTCQVLKRKPQQDSFKSFHRHYTFIRGSTSSAINPGMLARTATTKIPALWETIKFVFIRNQRYNRTKAANTICVNQFSNDGLFICSPVMQDNLYYIIRMRFRNFGLVKNLEQEKMPYNVFVHITHHNILHYCNFLFVTNLCSTFYSYHSA